MFEIIQYPFFQRAIIAGIFLAALLGFLGIFVAMRRMSFFSDGIAHASLLGIAIGILASWNPLLMAIFLAMVLSLLIYFLEQKFKLASDTAIGIIFTAGMALGVVLMSFKAGYQPDIISFLFGNILSIVNFDLWLIIIIGFGILLFVLFNLRSLTLLSLNRESAILDGVSAKFLEPLFYIFLSVSIVLGIKVLGIILVSALLVTPVATAKILAASFRQLLIISFILGELAVISGLFLSFVFDLPTGPVIVLVATLFFILGGSLKCCCQKHLTN